MLCCFSSNAEVSCSLFCQITSVHLRVILLTREANRIFVILRVVVRITDRMGKGWCFVLWNGITSFFPSLFSYEALWDQILEGRIKMQKALVIANRLPQPDTFPLFRKEGGQEFDSAVESCKNSSNFLLCVESAVANVFLPVWENIDREVRVWVMYVCNISCQFILP